MARIGFIGTGEIAAAMVDTIAGDGHQITVSRRGEAASSRLAEAHPGLQVAEKLAVVDDSDIVVLCLLADRAREVLPGLRFRPDQTVISVMARMGIAEIAQLCGPVTDICLAIPLPPMPLGGTPLAAFPDNPRLRDLFGPHAQIHACRTEQEIAAHFGVSGLLLPLLDQIDTSATWLAGYTGDHAGAVRYIAGLIGGTEGGLNQTLSKALKGTGTHEALENGLDGLRKGLGLPEVS